MKDAPLNAREALSSLVQDFKERLDADGEWGELGYEFPEEMPRYNAKAVAQNTVETPVLPQAPSQPKAETPESTTPLSPAPVAAITPPAPVSVSTPAPATAPVPSPMAAVAEKPQPRLHTPPPPPALGEAPRPGEGGTPGRLQINETGLDGLESVKSILGDCQRCPLHTGRKNLVFGEGNPEASIMFIGEGPIATEDEQGRPFTGPAGQLLDKMIVAMGYSREQVYIANVVKCRPPQDREPSAEEKVQCRPFLIAQIESVKPDVIVTLGKVATQALLETGERISRLRGRWVKHPHTETRVMPTYHPAALLKNAHLKRPVWEDLQKVMVALETKS